MANRKDDDRRKGRWQGFDFGGGGAGQGNRNPWRFLILYAAAGVLILFFLRGLTTSSPSKVELNKFFSQLDAHQVKEVSISSGAIDWTTKDDQHFTAPLPPNYDPSELVNTRL